MKAFLVFVCLLAIACAATKRKSPKSKFSSFHRCMLPCEQYTGFDGNTSATLQVSTYTNVVYNKESQSVFIHNERDNLLFVPYGQMLYCFNTENGDYLAIDQKTKYAIVGKADISSDAYKDYAVLAPQLASVCQLHKSISASTSGCFNFGSVEQSFYSQQFNISAILHGKVSIVKRLSTSFGSMFRLIKDGFATGLVIPARGLWGLFGACLGIKDELAVGLTNAFQVSAQTFRSVPKQFITGLFHAASGSANSVYEYSHKLSSYVAVHSKATADAAVSFAKEVKNNPVTFKLQFGAAHFAFSLEKVNGIGILSFKMQTTMFRFKVNIQMFILSGALVIINEHTGIVTAFIGKSLCIIHIITGQVLVGTHHLLGGLKGDFLIDEELGAYFQTYNYVDAVGRITEILSGNVERFSFNTLVEGMENNNLDGIGSCVGAEHAHSVQANFQKYFSQCQGASFGGIAIGIFSNSKSPLALALGTSINLIASTNANWMSFFSMTFKSQLNLFGGVRGMSSMTPVIRSKKSKRRNQH